MEPFQKSAKDAESTPELIVPGFYKDERSGILLWEKMSKALSIDCSVNTVGFATLQISYDEQEKQKAFDWQYGMWRLEGDSLLARCLDLCMYVQQSGNADFSHLIIEWPMFYESTKGQIAAEQSYTINLAAIGAYLAGFFHTPLERVKLVTAPQWKGNASKDVTARRFFRRFGVNHLHVDHNAIDACMMLLADAEKNGWLMPI